MIDSDRRDDRLLRLNAALDNELDATHRLELDRELEHDPQARAGLNRLSAVSDAVRRHAPREAAPASLHAAGAALARPRQATGRAYLPLAAALAAGVVIGAASQGVLVSSRAPDPVAATLTADFARAQAQNALTLSRSAARRSTSPTRAIRWLAGASPSSARRLRRRWSTSVASTGSP